MQEDDTVCDVCTEALEAIELPCGHHVHLQCIARSGQNVCPVCRREVVFTAELQELYTRQRAANEEEQRQRESNESLALARQLQRNDEPEVERRIRVNIHGVTYTVRFRDAADGAVSVDDLTLQLNMVLHNIATRVREFEVDERTWHLYVLMRDINELSATSGLGVTQLFSIIENNMF